ncbi:MAG: universal stress protein [Solirubrobacterales bacterium]|nr:universal stress protein [Solirubrobacterales bacterium]MBV8947412.1 universal stress protein [Solirubrobacterales bacterium]MBV9364588.1 universal stress protein [Solirubrobacterales bacterium]MBV9808265.1 universal stress protein [Solirubrobacterales bacterium]
MPAPDSSRSALLCWDGSDGAVSAMQHAARILGAGHDAVVLFAHVPTESARGVLAGFSGPDAPIMGISDAEDLLERGVEVAREAGFNATGLRIVAERKTSEIVVAVAEERDAVLIVMGQRQRSPLGTLLLGSVARDVLSSNHRPVMLVGPGSSGPQRR